MVANGLLIVINDGSRWLMFSRMLNGILMADGDREAGEDRYPWLTVAKANAGSSGDQPQQEALHIGERCFGIQGLLIS